MDDIINIDGTEYSESNLNEEQSYLIKQLRSCKAKIENLLFEMDQIKMAEQALTNTLLISIKTTEEATTIPLDVSEENRK